MPKYQFTVSVETQYVPDQSAPDQALYSFAYTITISNSGDTAAQLISRHWVITDANGQHEEVKGLGVVGHQPLLKPGESFQYTSGCRLRTSSGGMHGTYFCVAEDGEKFDATIAPFMLDAGGGPARVLH